VEAVVEAAVETAVEEVIEVLDFEKEDPIYL
jgi:hypothetical protein